MKKVIVLDFETGNIYIRDYSDKYDDFSDFLEDLFVDEGISLSESNCQWMIIDELNMDIKITQ